MVPYMVRANVNGDVAANIVIVSPEFERDSTEDQFREVMRNSVKEIVAAKYGEDAEYELTWERGESASLSLQ